MKIAISGGKGKGPCFPASLVILCLLWAGGGCVTEKNNPWDADADVPDHDSGDADSPEGDQDSDSDTISDGQEGRYDSGGPVDTDGDGTPDYQDEDSDDDTIPDEVEAGPTVSVTGPADSDGDGTPDYRETDSDDNGIPDSEEGTEDEDGDGKLDYADPDNDGDTFTDAEEIGGNPRNPVDTDRDGKRDYMDIDSDADLIADIQETHNDTDGDTLPNRVDLDSDGDTLTDAYEAGDDDYDTWPPDTDDDTYPNFMDVDSDSDGLADGWEVSHELDPYRADSDGDDFEDLIEIAAESDPLDPDSTPNTVGNFFFIVDYGVDPLPPEGDIVFKTNIKYADIFFLMDTTGSMGGEISQLKVDLSTTIVPSVGAVIEDVHYGVGGFDDYPVSPYGGEPPTYNDRVFYLLQKMTEVTADVQAAVELLTTHYGGDCSESQVPALYASATGSGYSPFLEPQLDCDISGGEFGYPCFRPGAVPLILLLTDASFHNGPGSYDAYSGVTPRPVTYDDTVAALRARHIRVISLISSSGGCGPAMDNATRLAQDTSTIDADGDPLVFGVSGSGFGLGARVVEAVQTLTGNVPVDISVSPRDDLLDSFDALRFIADLFPSESGGTADPADPAVVCEGELPVEDRSGDTIPDIFKGLQPGTVVCFHLVVNRNDFVEPTEDPQTFKAYVDIMGDEFTVLDTRRIIFMVPPDIKGPGVPE